MNREIALLIQNPIHYWTLVNLCENIVIITASLYLILEPTGQGKVREFCEMNREIALLIQNPIHYWTLVNLCENIVVINDNYLM